jgi:Second Longin domain of FUZ, MON1 and HPS1
VDEELCREAARISRGVGGLGFRVSWHSRSWRFRLRVRAWRCFQRGGALFGVLLAADAVVAVVHPKASRLHPDDMLLLVNFIGANDSFRQVGEGGFCRKCGSWPSWEKFRTSFCRTDAFRQGRGA